MRSSKGRHVAVGMLAVAIGGAVWLWGRSAGRHEARDLHEASEAPSSVVAQSVLDPTVRALLKGRMRRHSDGADRLWRAFLEVNYTAMAIEAEEIAAEPRLREPTDSEDPSLLNSRLPPAFFVYQDDLSSGALSLKKAAASGDADAVLASFERIMASCFACHVHYRGPTTVAPR